jgi:SMC interacting uncharacterized protein involved in chromosome segregation
MNNGTFSCVNARSIAANEVNAVRADLLPRILRMESDVRTLESQVTILRSTFSALSQRIPAGDVRLNALQQQITNAQQEVNVLRAETSTLRQRIETVGLGPIVRFSKTSDDDCQLYKNMKCPDGYIANAYEARIPGSSTLPTCSIQCRRLLL